MNRRMHLYYYAIVNFMVIFLPVECYIFNSESVKVIGGDTNSYFSYSLLLQCGEGVASLIVGAPRNSNSSNGGGNIYKCDLLEDGSNCLKYPIGDKIDTHIVNGNFFGASLDGSDTAGGPFVACAPRRLFTQQGEPRLRGYCSYVSISRDYQHIMPFVNSMDYLDVNHYKDTYYDFAFAMLGFDVSYYSENQILLGAPGVKKFNGVTVSLSANDSLMTHLMPSRRFPSALEEDTYFGYAVKVAKFQKSEVWYLAGAPRANDLRGKVTLYYYNIREKEKMHIVASFDGEEVGAYFGATLLVSDVDNDDLAEIIVGAPTAGGKTWDEGAVYVYKGLNGKSFTYQIKLTGSASPAARFGSALVTLGDLDLDGFNDIAVSAPYENDGVGAVYVYMGSKGGLLNKYSQRIAPSDFKMTGGPSPKGFGMGLSRGNDIDGNGHNDIAIGAYKTDQVFIVKTYSVIDYRASLFSAIPSITRDIKEFNIQLCLVTTKRSSTETVTQADFHISLELDYRSVDRKIEDQLSVRVESNSCKDYLISLKKSTTDIFPFSIVLSLNVVSENIVAHGDKSLELSVPYSHECGNDDICLTDLSLQLQLNRENFVLGADKEVGLVVSVNNQGEPAYQCRVLLFIPSGFDLRNTKDCVQTEGNYSCLISDILKGSSERKFVLDVKNVKPDTERITFYAEVTSLGKNNPAAQSRVSLDLPLVLENTPFINGKSTPEYSELELSKSVLEDFEVTYQFTLGKNGPSPLLVNMDIWLPLEEYNGKNIFTITEVEGTVGNIRMGCQSTVEVAETNDDGNSTMISVNVSQNRTIALKCHHGRTCVKYSCGGEYLESSSQLAVFTVRTVINFKLLGLKHKEKLSSEDLIAYIPVAYQTSPTGRVEKSILFLIFVHLENYVPLWVYLVAAIGGILLLILLSYGLYKCHFFDRIYKDKLEQEKTLLSPGDYDLHFDRSNDEDSKDEEYN